MEALSKQEDDMVTVSLPKSIIRELRWLQQKTGAPSLTDALNQAISTEAYIINEIERSGKVVIVKKSDYKSSL